MSLKNLVRSTINNFGFDIIKVSRIEQCGELYTYETVRPLATYSPWRTDSEFQEVFASINGYTMVDKYRCYELWKLIEQSAKLDAGALLEIGVWRGGTGALIASQAKKKNIQDKVFLCDTFSGVVKAGDKDPSYKDGIHADTSLPLVKNLIYNTLKLDNVELLEGIFPDETGHNVEKLTFRFCHVDVDIYQSAKDIMDWLWGKIIPGGIIVFDDYGFSSCSGITDYVNEQTNFKDRILIQNLNGHAIIIKIA